MNRGCKRNRAERRLKTSEIAKLQPGWHEDGGGLRLFVEPSGARRWVQRVTINGKRRDRGLGSFSMVSLEDARDESLKIRRAARAGRDHIADDAERQARMVTFRQAFEMMFELRKEQLSNAKHLNQWSSTMEAYVFPRIGDKLVAGVTSADVIAILRPIWFKKAETARRVLQRMEAVFKSAYLLKQRETVSPCYGVREQLGVKHLDVEHHRALPYQDVPGFIDALRASPPHSATKLAFEWLILTATRSGEARGARWVEIEEKNGLWTIPKERMKGEMAKRRPHVVPLPKRCRQILKEARRLNPTGDLLFPGPRTGEALSDMTLTKVLRDLGFAEQATAHGFRSSFRTWATEVAKAREVVAEAALAHAVRDKTEAAYRRATYLVERRRLMERWARYCRR